MKRYLLLALLLTGLPAQADEATRHILVDLDQVLAAGRVEPVDGITSAGQPDEKELAVFAESGYVLVIDMRGPEEDRGIENYKGTVEATGMQYVAFPIADDDDISFEAARELDALLEDATGPVLLHCKSGNRVGAVLALRESLAGADVEAALRYGRDAGMTRLEPLVRKVLEAE